MNKAIGIIGCGNMGRGILEGILKNGLMEAGKVFIYDKDSSKTAEMKERLGVNVSEDSTELMRDADVVVLAVKPNIYKPVLEQIKGSVRKDQIIVTIAAGINLAFVEGILGKDKRIVRTMPNTPALVGEGMTAVVPGKGSGEDDLQTVVEIFKGIGKVEVVPEYLIDAVIGISGSAPAYVYMFIEAMADGAVRGGMPRDKAYRFASQAVLGSAKMVLESGMHPGELKDMVCSPGGTTIEAVASLEENGFRGVVIDAVEACMEKSIKMSKRMDANT
ncbi:MAG: pyrroline-5-carboxylate reductase [Clostridiales bacterium]|nr:MAG: pyrroline-5-carboxylate reductase [Clostridiales bacterium]